MLNGLRMKSRFGIIESWRMTSVVYRMVIRTVHSGRDRSGIFFRNAKTLVFRIVCLPECNCLPDSFSSGVYFLFRIALPECTAYVPECICGISRLLVISRVPDFISGRERRKSVPDSRLSGRDPPSVFLPTIICFYF